MTSRKVVKRTGRRTVRVHVKTPKARGRNRRHRPGALAWMGRIFGANRRHKHTGKNGWWLN